MNDTKEQIFTLDEFQKSEKHKIRESFSIKLESSDLTIVALKEFQLPYDRLSKVFWEKPETIILSFCPSLIAFNGVQVYLGHKDRFEFGEFQINFFVEREKLKEKLDNGGTFGDLIKIAEPGESEYDRIQALRAKHPGEKGEYFLGPRKKDIQHPNFDKVTAKRLCFDPARILLFFDANLYNTLDFFLTYGNNDLVRAMQLGRLKNYFENISCFYLDTASTAMFRTIFFENSLAGREYDDLCSNAGVFRDDTFTGKRCCKKLNDETVLGKIVALHEFFHQNNKNSDLEALKGYILRQISTHRNCPKNVFDVYLNFFDIRPQDFLLGFYAVWGRGNDSAKEFAVLMGELLSFCDVAYRLKEVHQFKVIDIEFFLLNIFYLPKYIVERLLEWKKSQKTKHERYRLFLELHTTLRFMLMNYNANTEVDILLRKILVFFEHLEEINLGEILTAYAAGHSACELEKYWNDISCSGEFKYFEYSGMTLLPPKSHQALANNILMQKTNEELAAANASVVERDNIITTISHNIKGTIGSVITNLNGLKGIVYQNRSALEGALRGVEIISNMVSDIQRGYKYTYEMFYDDICSPDHDGICFYDIVLWGTKIVIDSIFSDDFYEEQKRFFSDDEKECLYGEYTSLSEGLDCLQEYINKNLASMEFRIPEHLLKTKIGNRNGTATNIYIVLNELMKNAFRALAQVPREKRVFSIEASERENDIVFVIENSCCPQSDQRVKGVGFGGLITSKIVAAFGRMEKTYSDNREYFTVQITVPKITGEKA